MRIAPRILKDRGGSFNGEEKFNRFTGLGPLAKVGWENGPPSCYP